MISIEKWKIILKSQKILFVVIFYFNNSKK